VARPGRKLTMIITAVSLIFTIAAPLNSSLRGATIPILTTTALVIAVALPLLNHLRTMHPARKTAKVPVTAA
jgi:alpha-1,6-mannosyltransferase